MPLDFFIQMKLLLEFLSASLSIVSRPESAHLSSANLLVVRNFGVSFKRQIPKIHSTRSVQASCMGKWSDEKVANEGRQEETKAI